MAIASTLGATFGNATVAIGGAVLVLDTEVELGRFHLLTFAAERLALTDFDALRERLVGTGGHFRVEGDVPPDLVVAYDDRKSLPGRG